MHQLSPIIGFCSVFDPRRSSSCVSKTHIKIIRVKFAQLIFTFSDKDLHFVGCGEKKVVQSCPTLCDPMDYTVRGMLQARILEWVTIPFSRGSSQPRDQTQVSRIAGGFFTSWATNYPKPCALCIYCPSIWQACHTEIQQGSAFAVIALLCSSGKW